MKGSSQIVDLLKAGYQQRHPVLLRLASNISEHLQSILQGQLRVDRISARAKDVNRFLRKAATQIDGRAKYSEPLDQIQDQIGARIVVFYKSDVDRIDAIIKRYFTAIEFRRVVPDSEAEFGYFGHHSILVIPSDVVDSDMDRALVPNFFELQIKTLFQHAWSEEDRAYAAWSPMRCRTASSTHSIVTAPIAGEPLGRLQSRSRV